VVPASAAAAATLRSAPACRPSSRNIRAASAGKAPERPREDRTNRGGLVVVDGGKQVKPVLLAGKLTGHIGQPDVRTGGDPIGRDPQRQRQVSAVTGQVDHSARLGVHSRCADDLTQQGDRLGRGQRIDSDLPGTVAGAQAGQPAAAGHHYHATG